MVDTILLLIPMAVLLVPLEVQEDLASPHISNNLLGAVFKTVGSVGEHRKRAWMGTGSVLSARILISPCVKFAICARPLNPRILTNKILPLPLGRPCMVVSSNIETRAL